MSAPAETAMKSVPHREHTVVAF